MAVIPKSVMNDQNQIQKIRNPLKTAKRIVVKIGSRLLVEKGHIAKNRLAHFVDQVAKLHQAGHEVAIVSSGAVAAGMEMLQMSARPQKIPQLQMVAAVGQNALVAHYNQEFQQQGLQTAQILLTHDDLSQRQRHLNARHALFELFPFHSYQCILD